VAIKESTVSGERFEQMSNAELEQSLKNPPAVEKELDELIRVCTKRDIDVPPHLIERNFWRKVVNFMGACVVIVVAIAIARSSIKGWAMLICAAGWAAWWMYQKRRAAQRR